MQPRHRSHACVARDFRPQEPGCAVQDRKKLLGSRLCIALHEGHENLGMRQVAAHLDFIHAHHADARITQARLEQPRQFLAQVVRDPLRAAKLTRHR